MAGIKLRFVLFTILVTLVIWGQTAFSLYDRRANALDDALREVSTLARTLEVQAMSSISATDLLLRLITHEVEEQGWLSEIESSRSDEIQAYLGEIRNELPHIANLALIDAKGRFVAQSLGRPPPGITAHGREYFQAMLEHPDRDQHISHAFYGRMSRKLVFSVSRRIRGSNGEFIGMVLATIDPSYFSTIYASLDIERDGIIALFDSQGTLVERFPDREGSVGRSIADRPLFTEHLPRSDAGAYINALHRDGHERIIGYRKLTNAPLVITVAKSLSESLSSWRQEVWRQVSTVAGITLLLAFGCVVILRETARRQASQRSLEKSEQRFRSTFDHAPVGIAHLDLDGRWLLTNPALRDMIGYTEAELRNMRFSDLAHAEERAGTCAAWEALVRGELSLYSSERRCLRKDGRPIWVSLTASLQSGGAQPYVLSILADITSRKSADTELLAASEQLRRSEETSRKQALILQSIIASMTDGVIVADEQRRILLFNPAARALFGDSPGDIADSEDCVRMFGLFHPDCQTRLAPDEFPLARALRGEKVDSADMYVRNGVMRDGAFVSVSAAPMLDDAGVIRGAVLVCRDVTEARLTGEALRQAQKMEAVGQLTGGIAHDFNNLLQIILGNSEILIEGLKADAHQRKIAQMTLTAAHRGAELTNQLLSFSRQQSLQPRPTDVRKLITETESLMSGSLGVAIDVRQQVPADLWQAVVDPGMLQNALVNLMLNARDAMPNGGRITIQSENFVCDEAYASRHKEVRPGEYVRINVADTGMGIPAAHLDKVFEPFFTTKDVGKGSGLGLSMVYGFIQQSGGAIRIRSSEGHGTIVRLYLPRATAEQARTPAPIASPAPQGSETILVVEDDPLVRDFVVAALRGLGYAVLSAADGHSALQCLKIYEGQVHLLFSDIVMPGGLSGWELARQATVLHPGLKVLFTSGHTDVASGPSPSAAERKQLLAKPYSKTDLANAVRKALGSDEERLAS